MKAAQINKFGGNEVVEILETNIPHYSPGKVLIEVHAASVNPIDSKVRSGIFAPPNAHFPITLGGDFAGVITEVGDGVVDFKIGQEVFGHASVLAGGSGSYAEFLVADSKGIFTKPNNTTFEEAASLPLTGISAIIALEEHMQLKAGQKILVHGAAGGIGSAAVQLAKHIGAYVAATAGTNEVEFVKNLGADEVIDYKTQKFEEVVHDFDTVFDTVGGDTYKRSFQVLKTGGLIVSMLEKPNEELEKKYGVKVISQFSQVTSPRLKRLKELVEAGVVKPHVDKVFPLTQSAEALNYLETAHPKGKVVINTKELG